MVFFRYRPAKRVSANVPFRPSHFRSSNLHRGQKLLLMKKGHGVARNAYRLMTPTVDDTVGASYEPTERWFFYFPHPKAWRHIYDLSQYIISKRRGRTGRPR